MPFKSKRQMRWMFANDPKMAKKWASHTKDIEHLPEEELKEFDNGADPESFEVADKRGFDPLQSSVDDEKLPEEYKVSENISLLKLYKLRG